MIRILFFKPSGAAFAWKYCSTKTLQGICSSFSTATPTQDSQRRCGVCRSLQLTTANSGIRVEPCGNTLSFSEVQVLLRLMFWKGTSMQTLKGFDKVFPINCLLTTAFLSVGCSQNAVTIDSFLSPGSWVFPKSSAYRLLSQPRKAQGKRQTLPLYFLSISSLQAI